MSKKPIQTGTADSTSSEESTFKVGNPSKISASLESFNKEVKGEIINDTFCFLMVCPTHKKVAVAVNSQKTAFWLPFIYASQTISIKEAIAKGFVAILGNQDKKTMDKLKTLSKPKEIYSYKILEVLRIQLPKTLRIVTRITCLIVLKKLRKLSPDLCPNHNKSDRIEWLDRDKVSQIEFWGPEVRLCLLKYDQWQKDSTNTEKYQEIKEFFIDDVYQYYGRTPPKNMEEYMLNTLAINEHVVDRLFIDFLEHCFPSFYMSRTSLIEYLCKYGVERTDSKLNNLFNAFSFYGKKFISFHELLLGLAAIDPMAPHNETRYKFLFRYYDSDRNAGLSKEEFKVLIKDLNKMEPEDVINQKVKEYMEKMKPNKEVSYDDFRKSIANLQFRGTSALCRASTQLFSLIGKVMLERAERINKQKDLKNTITEYVSKKKYSGICKNCMKHEDVIALHSVTLQNDGLFVGAQEINESETN